MSKRDQQKQGQLLPAFADFVPELVDKLQQVTDAYLDDFNEHQAFVYLVAELFETTDKDRFTFTDGSKDGGIDFFIQDIQSYTIYQCKCPALETLEHSQSAPTFDNEAVQQILAAVRFLRDQEGMYDVKKEIARLRTDFQRDFVADSQSTLLNAILAIPGELTPAAQKAFEAERHALRAEGVNLSLVTWREIYRVLHEMEMPADVDFSVSLYFDNLEKELLQHRDYCYVLAHAVDFYEAWRQHEWNLFDWNVRLQMPRSAINRRIVASLSKAKTRKIFHHLNNGILITCRQYRIDRTRKRIRLDGPQIINGCQTVCAIRDAYESLPPYEQQDFQEQARVQVKVLRETDPEVIAQMVITTNDQNAMNPRNLKSNTVEQKDLQRHFRELHQGWFYERKDGEWQSLQSASHRVRWFRKSDYVVRGQAGRARYRMIDNEQLAKYWYAWIGYSERALRGGLRYFEQEDVYNRIFRSRPNEEFWHEFGANPYFLPTDDHFSPGLPSCYQYLIAVTVGEYVRIRRVGWNRNKEEALRRGLEQGELRGDSDTGEILSTRREIDEFLANDTQYRFNIMLNNMREILIELMSFVLTYRYGHLSPAVCRTMLHMPEIEAFCFSCFNPELAPQETQCGDSILGPVYAFLRYCIKQYFFENRAEIQAAARLKAYFFPRKTVHRIRDMIVRMETGIIDWDQPWKTSGKTFAESLPDIS